MQKWKDCHRSIRTSLNWVITTVEWHTQEMHTMTMWLGTLLRQQKLCWGCWVIRNFGGEKSASIPYYMLEGFLDARRICKTWGFPAAFAFLCGLNSPWLVAKPITGTDTVILVKLSRLGRDHPDFFLDDFHVPFSSTCSLFRRYAHLQDFAGSNEIKNNEQLYQSCGG